MAKIALATYTMRMRHRRGADPLILDNTHLPTSFAEEFRLFVALLQRAHDHNQEAKSVLSTLDLHDELSMVWGLVNAGEYGMRRDVVRSDTNEPAYRVAPDEAVLHPFYFMLYAPPQSTRAIYILQRHGNIGIHNSFTGAFRKFFTERNPNLIFDVARHVPREVLEYLRDGHLKKVDYTGYRIPRELEELVRLGGNEEQRYVVRMSVKARRRGEVLPVPEWVPRFIERRINGAGLLEAPAGFDVEQERIQLTFQYGGNERTIDLSRPDSLAPYVDVSREVRTTEDGHPDPADLHRAALRLRDDIIQQIGRV